MLYTKNSGYGAFLGPEMASGKVFFVAATTDSNYQTLQEIWTPDPEGQVRFYNNITDALSACVTGRCDKILLSSGFVTAPTLTELATANTKGVLIEQVGGKLGDAYVTLKATTTLPATAYGSLFTVTAPIRLLDIVGEVTTAVQNQVCTAKFVATPTVGSAVDLSGTVSIANLGVGTIINMTGTLATAAAVNANGVLVAQAAPTIVPAGTVGITTSATNTGSLKYFLRYQPLLPGARVFAA